MTQRVELSGTQWVSYTQGWDIDNRLIAITSSLGYTSTFYYSADGERVKKLDSNGGWFYIGNILEKDMTRNVRTTYYYLGSQRVAMRIAPSGPYTGTLYWLHGDHLGSASLTTNISGTMVSEMRYYPYGETRYESGTTPTNRRYTGQLALPDIGTYDYGARFYVPSIGRFLSADTIVPRSRDTGGLNRYAYTLNNPLRYVDLMGHDVNCSGTDLQCKKETLQEEWFAYLDKERGTCSQGGGANCGDWTHVFGFLLSWAVAPEMVLFDIAVSARDELLNKSGNTVAPVAIGSVRSVGTGWALGDPVNQPNSDGSYPKDTQVIARYWQNRAYNAAPEEFSESNLAAMRAGYGPSIRVWVTNNRTGVVSNERFVKEIHHIDGRGIEDPHNSSNLMETWPWEHTAIDRQRSWGYTLLDNLPLRINQDPAQSPIEP